MLKLTMSIYTTTFLQYLKKLIFQQGGPVPPQPPPLVELPMATGVPTRYYHYEWFASIVHVQNCRIITRKPCKDKQRENMKHLELLLMIEMYICAETIIWLFENSISTTLFDLLTDYSNNILELAVSFYNKRFQNLSILVFCLQLLE